jgi:hypothetical protein
MSVELKGLLLRAALIMPMYEEYRKQADARAACCKSELRKKTPNPGQPPLRKTQLRVSEYHRYQIKEIKKNARSSGLEAPPIILGWTRRL